MVVLFHHAQGLTSGCLAFADALRAEGHTVHTPDLYDGKTFATLAEGMAYADAVGFHTILERGGGPPPSCRRSIVYAGFSLGVMPAQMLAQTRPGARGALLLPRLRPAVGVRRSVADGRAGADPHDGAATSWVTSTSPARSPKAPTRVELFVYPGDQHLFTDNSLPDYDEAAAALVQQRVREFLGRID